MNPNLKLGNMKEEHDAWQGRIQFLKKEIETFKSSLGSVVVGDFKLKNAMASVEHFQNQFILQREQLDIIRHDLKQHENLIEDVEKGKGKGKEPSPGLDNVHKVQREKLEQFEKIFHDLRKEFNVFLDKVDY